MNLISIAYQKKECARKVFNYTIGLSVGIGLVCSLVTCLMPYELVRLKDNIRVIQSLEVFDVWAERETLLNYLEEGQAHIQTLEANQLAYKEQKAQFLEDLEQLNRYKGMGIHLLEVIYDKEMQSWKCRGEANHLETLRAYESEIKALYGEGNVTFYMEPIQERWYFKFEIQQGEE
ncbi:MAG: hypothetical protein RR582_04505 [Niameybacter sp.]